MQKIEGGYLLVRRNDVSLLKAHIASGSVTTSEARGILGFLEMRSIREAAEAKRAKNKKGRALIPNYSSKELSKLTNLPQRVASKVFKIAISSDLFSSEKGKLVPIPRRIIRFLAKCEKRSTILVLLAYIERGLSLDKGKVKNAGTAKASFIAETTGLSLRSVRLARKELLELGILTPDTTKYQRKLNRDGAYFTISLSWCNFAQTRKNSCREEDGTTSKSTLIEKKLSVDNSVQQVLETAPLPLKNCTKIAPPIRDLKSSKELRNQKSQEISSNKTGIFIKQEKNAEGEGRVLLPPSIWNVQKGDLEKFSRCKMLYEQVCETKLMTRSEANFLNFVGAAIRAKTAKRGDAAKIFMGIVKKNLWMNITQEQEDRARAAIRKYLGH